MVVADVLAAPAPKIDSANTDQTNHHLPRKERTAGRQPYMARLARGAPTDVIDDEVWEYVRELEEEHSWRREAACAGHTQPWTADQMRALKGGIRRIKADAYPSREARFRAIAEEISRGGHGESRSGGGSGGDGHGSCGGLSLDGDRLNPNPQPMRCGDGVVKNWMQCAAMFAELRDEALEQRRAREREARARQAAGKMTTSTVTTMRARWLEATPGGGGGSGGGGLDGCDVADMFGFGGKHTSVTEDDDEGYDDHVDADEDADEDTDDFDDEEEEDLMLLDLTPTHSAGRCPNPYKCDLPQPSTKEYTTCSIYLLYIGS